MGGASAPPVRIYSTLGGVFKVSPVLHSARTLRVRQRLTVRMQNRAFLFFPMTKLWLDFETRSRCDLKKHGVYNYAQDMSTEVLCMSYAFDDGEVQTWLPHQEFPEAVRNHKGLIYAHNAAFERLIFWYVLQINFDLEQFYCTATQARANCAPGSLEDVGRFAGADMRKDHRGSQLIRLLSIPQANGQFREDAALMAEMVAYCEQDVRAMRAISQALRPLSDVELLDYHVNERINDRGILVDVPLCHSAVKFAADEAVEIQQIVTEVTEGVITSVRSPKMREWVLERVGDEAKKLMWTGEKYSIDKNVRANLLAMDDPEQVPPDVADVIQCADDLWASSVAKFNRLAQLADEEDHRVRGALVFAGGSATGRASSYGAQVHNFPRKSAKDPDAVRTAMVRGHKIVPQFGARITDVLKTMLRPAIVAAPGNVLIAYDWSAIEGRVHPWLSNCKAGEAKLDVFRSGLDPYKVNAAATFRVDYAEVTGDQRQIGKVQELACLGPETQVLTHNGVKAIVDVQLTDQLWDGEQWVNHQGVISKGQRQTINVCGMEVTPDHLIRTQQTWAQAQQLASNKQLLTQALATGSANLPSWAPSASNKARPTPDTFVFNACVVLNRIWSIFTICAKERQRGAMSARKSPLDFGAKTFTNMPMPVLMTITDGACSTGYLLAKTDATTPKIETIQTMAAGGFIYMNSGAQTKPIFCATFVGLTDGISRIWSWTASTSTKAMSLATFDLSLGKLTAPISVKFKRCSNTSSNLRPVFDILNSGSRNQFTVLTDAGPLIVHNCGFLGGAGAFEVFGRVYGLKVSKTESQRAVDGWRKANPWAMQHGNVLEDAYLRAMRNKGHEFKAGRIVYLFDGQTLWYALPSGRVLCYPNAKFDEQGNVTYTKAAWKPAADAKEWPRARLWKGLACENVVQATANDILRESLRQLDGVIAHVHDEIVVECPARDAEAVAARMHQIMCTAPAWAEGLPLGAEGVTTTRYS